MIKRNVWARFFLAGSFGCVLAMTQGCGMVLTHGPPVGHEQMYYFDCTESRTGPILDLVVAGLHGVAAASAATDPHSDPYVDSSGQIAMNGVALAVFAVSGYVGLMKTSRCREAHRLLADRLTAQGLAGSIPGPGQAGSVPSAVHVYPAEGASIGKLKPSTTENAAFFLSPSPTSTRGGAYVHGAVVLLTRKGRDFQ